MSDEKPLLRIYNEVPIQVNPYDPETMIYTKDEDIIIEYCSTGRRISLNETLEKIDLVLKKIEEFNSKT